MRVLFLSVWGGGVRDLPIRKMQTSLMNTPLNSQSPFIENNNKTVRKLQQFIK